MEVQGKKLWAAEKLQPGSEKRLKVGVCCNEKDLLNALIIWGFSFPLFYFLFPFQNLELVHGQEEQHFHDSLGC